MFQTCFTFLELQKIYDREVLSENNIYKMKPGEGPGENDNIYLLFRSVFKTLVFPVWGKSSKKFIQFSHWLDVPLQSCYIIFYCYIVVVVVVVVRDSCSRCCITLSVLKIKICATTWSSETDMRWHSSVFSIEISPTVSPTWTGAEKI